VNDYHVFFNKSLPKHIPQDAYKLLKAPGRRLWLSSVIFSYSELSSNMIIVPYLLSMWAIFHGREPAPRFNHDISREEEEAYFGKAQTLMSKDLDKSVEAVWNSIPPFDRSFMVTMHLSRPATREIVVHPVKPTIN
jgi:hypothetical protein